MSEVSYTEFSAQEAEIGVRYAREHHGIELPQEFVRELANRALSNHKRNSIKFRIALFEVLNGARIHATSPKAQKKRKAYESAIGKMSSERSRFARQKRANANQQEPKAAKGQKPYAENAKGQLEWAL